MSSLPLSERARVWWSKLPYRINRQYHSRLGRRSYNTDGISMIAADWDTLAILDACRYDTFAEIADLPGTFERRESRASTTQEFVRSNLGTRDLRDMVYVTASPAIHATDGVDPQLHAVVDLWADQWDDELRTVPPEAVTSAAIETHKQYPNKRLLVHYLQPHYPFIGTTGQEQFDHTAVSGPGQKSGETIDAKFWDTVGTRVNDVRPAVVREAYRENLKLTLPHVRNLLEAVDGKTVVTADHGEMLNDRSFPIPDRMYGHPPGLYTRELVKVPWHVHTSGERRRVTAGDATETDTNDGVIEERLRDLGYT